MIYLIISPGRTGSLLLTNFIKENIGVQKIYTAERVASLTITEEMVSEILKEKNSVIHSHDPNLVTTLGIDPRNVSLIISRRKDALAMFLSHIIAKHTEEYSGYTNKHVEPFKVDLIRFKEAYVFREKWYNRIHLDLPYANISTVYYEDVVSTWSTVNLAQKTLLNNIVKNTDLKPSGKSPYNFKDIIINWEELYDWYKSVTG